MNQEGWLKRLNVIAQDTGNGMDSSSVEELSTRIDNALGAYRLAVGIRRRAIVQQLRTEQFKQKVDPDRLELVAAEGAVLPLAQEILDYWAGRTIAGLLLMLPTRHNFI